MQLSKNFSLREMTKSQTATRKGIPNKPTGTHQSNLVLLCQNILQPIREHFKKPVRITSGYRSAELCVAIGSSVNSQHAKGQAADFEITGISNQVLAEYINENLNYDQLILEFWNKSDPNSGWVHCSFNNNVENRKQFLRAYRNNEGKVKYDVYNAEDYVTESDIIGGAKAK